MSYIVYLWCASRGRFYILRTKKRQNQPPSPATARQDGVGSKPVDKAIVLSLVGFELRAPGRLREAAQPMQAGLDGSIVQKKWKRAAIDAGNLSELYLTRGDVKQAVDYGRRSVDFAYQCGDGFHRESKRTTLADALHQAGEVQEAERLFQEAEAMQKERRPENPYLYSLWGFRFCDLLLNRGKYQEVQKRASKEFDVAKKDIWFLEFLFLFSCSFAKFVAESFGLGSRTK